MPEHPTGFEFFGDAGISRNPYGVAGDRASVDVGEFDWGAGLTPPGLEDAPPSEGGRYHGTTPPGAPQIRVSPNPRGSTPLAE